MKEEGAKHLQKLKERLKSIIKKAGSRNGISRKQRKNVYVGNDQ